MRLPRYVVRRRQGLYLRLRLPPDLARLSSRTHVTRSLGTGDPGQARALAARASAALHRCWDDVRADVTGTLRGVPVGRVTADDVRAALGTPEGEAELAALSSEDSAALGQRVRDLLAEAGRGVAGARDERERAEWVVEVARDARRLGQIEGLREALAAGASERLPQAHPDAAVPWSSLTERFFSARPGWSESTRVSYQQAFREFEEIIGEKNLSEITARDVAKYSEYLENKESRRGSSGILNRKTIVRMVGHVRSFISWAKSAGLLAVDPGAGVKVRQMTKVERKDQDEGSKRAFTADELERMFASPIYMGCASIGRRYKAGPNIYRDAKWWFIVVACLSGARCDELAQAPSLLHDLDGVLCIDLRHGTKTPAAPRLVPISKALAALGFVDYAKQQKKIGEKLFEARDWSKFTNKFIDEALGVDPKVSLHSFRHSFRQACSAAQLDDYLSDKVLGHRSMKGRSEGSGYGRALSPKEARLVVEKLGAPVSLAHLIPRPARRPAASHLP